MLLGAGDRSQGHWSYRYFASSVNWVFVLYNLGVFIGAYLIMLKGTAMCEPFVMLYSLHHPNNTFPLPD